MTDIANTDDVTTGATTEPTTEPGADEAGAGREAARYRTRLREAEAQRDGLSARLTAMQRAEVERHASAALSKGGDVWLDGVDVADLLDADGAIDPVQVEAAVAAVLDGRPGLAVTRSLPKPDHSQGVAPNSSTGSAWSDVLKGGRR